ncbi:MAG: hypothetical protein WBE44_00450 [Terriglobales bacterium]|jgi:hypothetical protein
MEAPSIAVPEAKTPWFGTIPAFALHTAIVYTCALRVSGSLVARWFAWVAPILQISSSVPPRDWYLQHFELVTIIPALIAGYINLVRFVPATVGRPIWDTRFDSAVTWAWSIPALVLSYKMLQYHAPSSVLFGTSMTAIKYFFDIQKVMPTWENPLASDPVRVAAQMLVTAPFYAGVAYSLGAFVSKHDFLAKLFRFEKNEE